MTSEKQFENRIKAYLQSKGCWFIKYWGGGFYTKEGIPDLLICCNGYFLGVEVKGANGKPTPIQLWNIEQIKSAGGLSMVLYPKDFDRFKALIEKLLEVPTIWDLSYEI